VGHSRRGCGPVFEELHQLLARFCDDVKCSEVQPILHGGEDARLMLAVERISTQAWHWRLRRGGLLASECEAAGSARGQPG
jgi:hypothetical protein